MIMMKKLNLKAIVFSVVFFSSVAHADTTLGYMVNMSFGMFQQSRTCEFYSEFDGVDIVSVSIKSASTVLNKKFSFVEQYSGNSASWSKKLKKPVRVDGYVAESGERLEFYSTKNQIVAFIYKGKVTILCE
jgi:hypothetical protein